MEGTNLLPWKLLIRYLGMYPPSSHRSMTSEIQQRDHATDFRNGVPSGNISHDDSSSRSRGGRYIKPSRKIKEIE
ncbi:unnamed protein product [Cochlearia groenlandica]